jgi:hypothetical protein
MSKQLRIYSNNRVFNYSLSGRELEPEEVDEVYGPNDPNLNIYLPDTEPARPDYEPESPIYERDYSDEEMLTDSEEEDETMSVDSYDSEMDIDSEMDSDSDGSDNESDCLIVQGPETWQAARHRLNLQAILNGTVRLENFDEEIEFRDEEIPEDMEDNDVLIVAGCETWEDARHRLNLQAILNGTVRIEVFDDEIDTAIIDDAEIKNEE